MSRDSASLGQVKGQIKVNRDNVLIAHIKGENNLLKIENEHLRRKVEHLTKKSNNWQSIAVVLYLFIMFYFVVVVL